MKLLNNIFIEFKELPVEQQLIVAGLVFALSIIALPNALVYALCAVASYKLIENSFWKYVGVIAFSILTITSLTAVNPSEAPTSQSANSRPAQEISETDKLNESEETEDVAVEKNLQEEVGISEVRTEPDAVSVTESSDSKLYDVVKVVDGDTIDVLIDGKTERIRLIGINTPETVDPRKPVECFGVEASNKAKELLTGKRVMLESDASQDERDKYGRLLRYVFLEDRTNFNLLMIKGGYAYEYTYNIPYKYQTEFKESQRQAEINKSGLWGEVCDNFTTNKQAESNATPVTQSESQTSSNSCSIKGNISSSGEKIFHVIGCQSYNKTVIDESEGESWFCSEQEALAAGWRKALNCN